MFADRQTLPILWTVILCTLPHFPYLSVFIVIACLLLWTYTFTAFRKSWRLPNPIVLKILAAVSFTAAMTTHEGFTIEAFVALLALMVALKLLEIRTERDRIITVILCYFLIVGGMFFGDTIGATFYKLFSILVTTAVLVHVNQPGRGIVAPFRLAGVLMLQAIPLMLVMFLLFPRIQGGVWGRAHLNLARTGFSDTISFGNIAELARSTAVAFRVEFNEEIPERSQLYWRGAVLWSFDGQTWKRGLSRRNRPVSNIDATERQEYTVTLEPHNENWLITLDLPTEVDFRHSRLLNDFTVYRWRPITSRIAYNGVSFLKTTIPLQERFRNDALQLPAGGNPKARALALSLADQAETAAGYVERVLTYFRDEPFYYTLKPPLLSPKTDEAGNVRDQNLIDRFLFESRKGFCEHFAGSFAFLMRAGGVPARVVVGYQGGTRNQFGGYLVIHQSDAHAWCEVWLEEKGWIRVDPTSIVVPERITADAAGALPPGEGLGFLSLHNLGFAGQWFGKAGNMLDFMNNRWNKWVMGYSTNEQVGLFSTMGLDLEDMEGWSNIALLTLVVGVMLIVLVSLFIFRQPKQETEEAEMAWLDFCEKMAKAGLPRKQSQGPADYLHHIQEQRPGLAHHCREIISSYVQIRYGRNFKPDSAASLRTMVKRFSPKKRK